MCKGKRQGFFRTIKTQGRGGEGGGSPKTPSPPPQTKVTIVGKNEIYNRENLVRPFLVHQVFGPQKYLFPERYRALIRNGLI